MLLSDNFAFGIRFVGVVLVNDLLGGGDEGRVERESGREGPKASRIQVETIDILTLMVAYEAQVGRGNGRCYLPPLTTTAVQPITSTRPPLVR